MKLLATTNFTTGYNQIYDCNSQSFITNGKLKTIDSIRPSFIAQLPPEIFYHIMEILISDTLRHGDFFDALILSLANKTVFNMFYRKWISDEEKPSVRRAAKFILKTEMIHYQFRSFIRDQDISFFWLDLLFHPYRGIVSPLEFSLCNSMASQEFGFPDSEIIHTGEGFNDVAVFNGFDLNSNVELWFPIYFVRARDLGGNDLIRGTVHHDWYILSRLLRSPYGPHCTVVLGLGPADGETLLVI